MQIVILPGRAAFHRNRQVLARLLGVAEAGVSNGQPEMERTGSPFRAQITTDGRLIAGARGFAAPGA